MKAGKDYGIRDAGYYALRELRIEKFYAFWGSDLTTHTTPLESGRDFRVNFEVIHILPGDIALLPGDILY